jgi:multidrug efflux pump subunit AcrA (membrane-fusion protein)
MTIRAPVKGRILSLVADPGTRLSDGTSFFNGQDGSTVVTMYRPESLQVRVDVRFEDLPKVSLDQPVRIESPAVARPLQGQVLFISSEADIQKNTLQVKVAIDSPPDVFKPEMLVDVTFLAPKPPDDDGALAEELHLLLPRQLIHQGESGLYVWLADRSAGRARRVPVQIGVPSSDGLTEIVGGLNVASRVIASGIERLSDGKRIRVAGEDILSTPAFSNGSKSHPLPTRYPSGDAH